VPRRTSMWRRARQESISSAFLSSLFSFSDARLEH
jgi:hypothetical protein